MLRPSPQPVAVSRSEAAEIYPALCRWTAEKLQEARVPRTAEAARLVASLEMAAADAGDQLSSFEQNYDGCLGDELDNMWRVLVAYSAVARGHDDDSAKVFPWMADRAEAILARLSPPQP